MNQQLFVAEGAGRYVHWGVIQVSVTNLVVIGLMIVLFVLALVLPFPKPRDRERSERRS